MINSLMASPSKYQQPNSKFFAPISTSSVVEIAGDVRWYWLFLHVFELCVLHRWY
jgi:hypothetical protein